MIMRGIDISNWQSGIKPSNMPIDFCIMKATEGTSFTDAYCDAWVEDCKAASMPWGFYHFAGNNDPVEEAHYFYKECKGYFKHGIPILDYETDNANNAEWCEKFIQRIYDLTKIWCIIYISAYRVPEYNDSWIPEKCGLWIAGYPQTYAYWPIESDCPYDIGKWEVVALWQFSDEVVLPGYVGKLDGDIAYMDEKAWGKYVGATSEKDRPQKPTYDKSIEELAREVLAGKHGDGGKRKNSLGKMYEPVQNYIDQLYNVADEVIAGKWGNGWNREQALNGAGYPYDIVQGIVNDKLGYARSVDFNGC